VLLIKIYATPIAHHCSIIATNSFTPWMRIRLPRGFHTMI
jgi:hypothetical protein